MRGDDDEDDRLQAYRPAFRAPYAGTWGEAATAQNRHRAWDGVSINFGAIAFLGVLGLVGLGLVLYFRRPALAPRALSGTAVRRLLEEGFV